MEAQQHVRVDWAKPQPQRVSVEGAQQPAGVDGVQQQVRVDGLQRRKNKRRCRRLRRIKAKGRWAWLRGLGGAQKSVGIDGLLQEPLGVVGAQQQVLVDRA